MFAQPKKASVLIISIEILALMAMLGISFFTISNLELKASKNYTDEVRAKIIAKAGLHYAIANLIQWAKENAYDSPQAPWQYEPDYQAPGSGLQAQKNGCGSLVRLEQSTNPSYKQTDGNRIYSGTTGNTYPGGLDYYLLKIYDNASRLNLNGPLDNLAPMAENLGRAIEWYTDRANPLPSGSGNALVAARYSGFFTSNTQIRELFGEERAETISHFVSFTGWKNPITRKPTPSPVHISQRNGLGDMGANQEDPDAIQARYPVNINTASKPVLFAVLAGLEGYRHYIRTTTATPLRNASPIEFATETVKLSDAQARALIEEICKRRRQTPFRSWYELKIFLSAYMVDLSNKNQLKDPLDSSPVTFTHKEAELVFANCCPNTMLQKFAPPKARALGHSSENSDFNYLQLTDTTNLNLNPIPLTREKYCLGMDKTDLIYHTTEFCFSSMGYFHIESLAYIEQKDGRIIAQSKISADVKIFDVVHLTSQKDFVLFGEPTDPGAPVITFPEPLEALSNKAAALSEGWLQLGAIEQPEGIGDFFLPFQKRNRPTAFHEENGDAPLTQQKNATIRLMEGGDLSPEGLLCWKDRHKELAYDSQENGTAQTGTVELWFKLITPPELGTNEVIAFANWTDPNKAGTGVCWRLERWGKYLVSTRFHYGVWSVPRNLNTDLPQNIPYQNVFNEVAANLENLKPFEWHRLTITWKNHVEQTLYIDGKSWDNTPDFREFTLPKMQEQNAVWRWAYSNQASVIPQGGTGWYRGGWFTSLPNVPGVQWDNNYQITVPDARPDVNIFQLRSNDASKFQIWLGGYTYQIQPKPGNSYVQLYTEQATERVKLQGLQHRYANIVLDDVRFFNSEQPPVAPARYPSVASYLLRIPIPSGATLGTLSWTVWYPRQVDKVDDVIPLYQRTISNNDPTLSALVEKNISLNVYISKTQLSGDQNRWTDPTLSNPTQRIQIYGNPQDEGKSSDEHYEGESYSIQQTVNETFFPLLVEFENQSSSDMFPSPVLDDITLTYITTPVIFNLKFLE
ncbi:MAG: hypothetical protein D6805_09955 [Planctomycetota bacterium]|nr:MAG: hypothetical protein D6805_09955 [Planctomycetota bacterium]